MITHKNLSVNELGALYVRYHARRQDLAQKLAKAHNKLQRTLDRQHNARIEVAYETEQVQQAQLILEALEQAKANASLIDGCTERLQHHQAALNDLHERYNILSEVDLMLRYLELELMEVQLAVLDERLREVQALIDAG